QLLVGREPLLGPGRLDLALQHQVLVLEVEPGEVVRAVRAHVDVVVGVDREEVLLVDQVLLHDELHERVPVVAEAQRVALERRAHEGAPPAAIAASSGRPERASPSAVSPAGAPVRGRQSVPTISATAATPAASRRRETSAARRPSSPGSPNEAVPTCTAAQPA